MQQCRQTLLNWDFRVHDRRAHAIHVIFVARQTVLARHGAGVTGLAEILFHRSEIVDEIFWIALLIALQIGAAFFEGMTGQAAAIFQNAEMRLMDEIGEAPLLRLDLGRGEIDQPPFALDIVDAVTFRA